MERDPLLSDNTDRRRLKAILRGNMVEQAVGDNVTSFDEEYFVRRGRRSYARLIERRERVSLVVQEQTEATENKKLLADIAHLLGKWAAAFGHYTEDLMHSRPVQDLCAVYSAATPAELLIRAEELLADPKLFVAARDVHTQAGREACVLYGMLVSYHRCAEGGAAYTQIR